MSAKSIKWLWTQQLNLLARDGNLCGECGIKMRFDYEQRIATNKGKNLPDDTLTIDHIIPSSKGGENTLNNFRLLCKKCNNQRGDKPIEKPIKSYRPPNEIWEYLKKENLGNTYKTYAEYSGNRIILRRRYKIRVTVDNG